MDLKQLRSAAILRAIEDAFTAAPNGTVLTKRSNAIEYAPVGGIIHSATLLSPVSRAIVNEGLAHEFTIPGNFLTIAGQHLEILMDVSGAGGANSTVRLRLGGLAGTTIAAVVIASSQHASLARRVYFASSSTLRTSHAAAAVPDFASQASSRQSIAIDWTQPQTFAATLQPGSAGVTTTLDSLVVRAVL